jgi:transposase
VVSNPQKTRAIAEAKVKTDKVDAAVLAGLLAANYLPAVWLPDDQTHALRRQVVRRAHIVRQRTRLKNQVQSILHRNLIPRCPAADYSASKAGRGWPPRTCPKTSSRRSGRCCASSTSTAKSFGSSTPNSAGSVWSMRRSAGC